MLYNVRTHQTTTKTFWRCHQIYNFVILWSHRFHWRMPWANLLCIAEQYLTKRMKSLRTAVRCIPLMMVLHKILFQLIQEVWGTAEIVLSNAFQSRLIQIQSNSNHGMIHLRGYNNWQFLTREWLHGGIIETVQVYLPKWIITFSELGGTRIYTLTKSVFAWIFSRLPSKRRRRLKFRLNPSILYTNNFILEQHLR